MRSVKPIGQKFDQLFCGFYFRTESISKISVSFAMLPPTILINAILNGKLFMWNANVVTDSAIHLALFEQEVWGASQKKTQNR